MTESSDSKYGRDLLALMSVKTHITLLPLNVQVNACSMEYYPMLRSLVSNLKQQSLIQPVTIGALSSACAYSEGVKTYLPN